MAGLVTPPGLQAAYADALPTSQALAERARRLFPARGLAGNARCYSIRATAH